MLYVQSWVHQYTFVNLLKINKNNISIRMYLTYYLNFQILSDLFYCFILCYIQRQSALQSKQMIGENIEQRRSWQNQPQDSVDPFEQPAHIIYLFINTGSGAGLGGKIINQQIRKMNFQIPIDSQEDVRSVEVVFVNMRKNKEFGFKKLKKLSESSAKRPIAIVCGGDGTVMWVISQFIAHGIDPMTVPIGIIPTGTGNDFSRSLNWGGQKTMLLQHNFRSLKKLIRKWIHAKQSQFDIWDVTAQIYPNGKFEKVQKQENVFVPGLSMTKTFVNYFSFGIDAKVGYSFDKHRTSSRIGNLAVYGALGVVKQASNTKTIDELIQSFYMKGKQTNAETLIFKSRFKSEPFQQKTQYITGGLKNILALNIDSYTGGVSGIWNDGKQLFKDKSNQRTAPSYNDGKLQIVSFGSAMGIAMQRTIGGFANRVAQDQGPFIFNFRAYPDQEKHRTYLQIDGQFLRFTHPKRVTIQKSKVLPNSRIKVLVNDPTFQPYIPKDLD